MHRSSLARFARPSEGRLVAGVSAGVARGLRLDVSIVRLALLLLCLAGGFGVVLYGALWLVLPESAGPAPETSGTRIDDLAALAVAVGVMLILREAGVWFADGVALIGAVAAVGLVLIWGRADSADAMLRDRGAAARIALGVVLVLTGFIAFNVLTGDVRALGRSALGAAITAAGIALLFGPWLRRLATELGAERRARIRSEEKAEIAAHLHDGVLQTLALIQRRAGSNKEVAALARRQERELRDWLYAPPFDAATTLSGSLARELGDVEDDQQVPVELVVVGDAALDEGGRVFVSALREAATNAARHAGADRVDVYVEVEADTLTGYVRDRGRGFDLAAVSADRRGVADSIIGRTRRAGGTAVVRSEPGEGTEVTVTMPRVRT